MLLIVHNCLHGKAPQDISALITYAPSERRMLLLETRVMSSYGDRAFSHIAPKLWNLLPAKIREEPVQDDFNNSPYPQVSFMPSSSSIFIEFVAHKSCRG